MGWFPVMVLIFLACTPQPTGRADADGDGWGADDCDDADASVFPGAVEVCNALDDDCDGLVDDGFFREWLFPDRDGDGHGVEDGAIRDCRVPAGYTTVADDCDDDDASVFPGAAEACNTLDDDCDGLTDEGLRFVWYRDDDGDGYGQDADGVESCVAVDGRSRLGGDCDDDDASVFPGATESTDCDTVDQDCDGRPREGLHCAGDTGHTLGWASGDFEFVDGVMASGTVVQRWYPQFSFDWPPDPANAICTATRALTPVDATGCGTCDWAYTYTLAEPVYEGGLCVTLGVDPGRPDEEGWVGFAPEWAAPYTDYAGNPTMYVATLVGADGVWPATSPGPFYWTEVTGDPTVGVTWEEFAFWAQGDVFVWR